MTGKVYILHFSEKFWHCRHYIGITNLELSERLARHEAGNASKLTAAVAGRGIKFSIHLLAEYPSMRLARDHEIKLKNHKKSQAHCPLCKIKN